MRNTDNTNSYPQGYLPKIAYHLARRDYKSAEFFAGRQKETYGPIEPSDIIVLQEMVNEINERYAQEAREFNSHLGRF